MSPTSSELERRKAALESELGERVTCDALTRDYVMFQRRRGHRHSTDDLLTAWYAAKRLPTQWEGTLRILDLGSGIGSIGLAVYWSATERGLAEVTLVEAQEVSVLLLRENVAVNGVREGARVIHGDLRDRALLPEDATFDVITGSPPYFDVSAGIVSADSQRAHARFELRGDVRDYALAAKRLLAPGGTFVLCFPTVQRKRATEACTAAGLRLTATCDVVPKEGAPPLFTLFACASEGVTEPVEEPPFVVRDRKGAHTPHLLAAQTLFGLDQKRTPTSA